MEGNLAIVVKDMKIYILGFGVFLAKQFITRRKHKYITDGNAFFFPTLGRVPF